MEEPPQLRHKTKVERFELINAPHTSFLMTHILSPLCLMKMPHAQADTSDLERLLLLTVNISLLAYLIARTN